MPDLSLGVENPGEVTGSNPGAVVVPPVDTGTGDGGDNGSIGSIAAHPDYVLKWLQEALWSVDDKAPLKLAITRKDGGIVPVPTGAVIKVKGGPSVVPLPADLEPNDDSGTNCVPAQVQFVAALYTFPAAGRYSVEAVITLGEDGQHRASTAQIAVS